jgi:hypothetical protein
VAVWHNLLTWNPQLDKRNKRLTDFMHLFRHLCNQKVEFFASFGAHGAPYGIETIKPAKRDGFLPFDAR